MTTVSAHDVAREIRRRLSGIGSLKLHKLLHYIQGFHLALTGKPLFSERIEAWTNGSVVARLWREERDGDIPPPLDLTDEQLATIAYVTGRYRQTPAPS